MPIKQADTLDYLSHHGIKGQKWGTRNGPPYPLTAKAKAKAYPKKGKSNTRFGSMDDDPSDTATVIALTTAVTALVVASKISQAVDTHKYKKTWESHREDNAEGLKKGREKEEIDPETGLHLKKKDLGIDDDLKKINPNFDEGEAFQMNCTMCTAALEMRRRGYDVAASALTDSRGGLPAKVYSKWFKPPTKHTNYDLFMNDSRGRMKKEIAAQGDGARGEFGVSWFMGGGHSMFYQVEKGKVVVYDGQSGKKYKGKELDEILDNCSSAHIRRLDNLEPNMDAINGKKNKPLC